MPTIVTPYHRAYLQDDTAKFVKHHQGQLVDVSDDDFAYWRLFAWLWEQRDTFVICEHDVIPTDEQYGELLNCPEAWCAFAYDRLGSTVATMGFCKFDPARLAETLRIEQHGVTRLSQESMEKRDAYAMTPHPDASIPWNQVDGVVWTFLTTRGYNPHIHAGPVEHRREARHGEHGE